MGCFLCVYILYKKRATILVGVIFWSMSRYGRPRWMRWISQILFLLFLYDEWRYFFILIFVHVNENKTSLNKLIERNADHSLQVEILSDVSNACGCPCHPSPTLHPPWPLWNTHNFPMPLCYPISLLGCNVNNSVHSEVLMPALASQIIK